jgi:uroporphyrinogen decarboxylase
MNSRERVLAALQGREPDRVPYCEMHIDRAIGSRLLGWEERIALDLEDNEFSVDEAKELAKFLGKDNITYAMRAPVYAEMGVGLDGRVFYGHGLIHSAADLDLVRFPDPNDDSIYEGAAAFVREKEDYSAWFVTRIGIFQTMMSLGIEGFSMALYDDLPLVERLFDKYVDWIEVVAERVSGMGFDAFLTADDMAMKTAPFFSPKVFRDLVLPRYQRAARKISLPWLLHSDGNVAPFLEGLVGAGVKAAHPMEPGAMDIRQIKAEFGSRLCLLGNVDVNMLTLGTPEEVDREVHGLIRDIAPGGGYILSSGNSLTSYCEPANVVAMTDAVKKYGTYPIEL